MIDGQEPKEYIFQSGARPQWKAREGFDILVGNAAGAEFEFSIVASVTIPIGVGGFGTEVEPEFQIIKIPANAWSPFQGREPVIEEHIGGPHLAEVSESTEQYGLEWHAIQMISPRFTELEDRVDSLEKQIEDLLE